MIVIGHGVGFPLPTRGIKVPYDPEKGWPGDHLWIPDTRYLLLRDAGGALGHSCDVYIAPKGLCRPSKAISQKEEEQARDLYGDAALRHFKDLSLPPGRWHSRIRVVGIDYANADARSDGRPTEWGHPFESPVWVYKHSVAQAWKVALPRFCLLDGRGFVRPLRDTCGGSNVAKKKKAKKTKKAAARTKNPAAKKTTKAKAAPVAAVKKRAAKKAVKKAKKASTVAKNADKRALHDLVVNEVSKAKKQLSKSHAATKKALKAQTAAKHDLASKPVSKPRRAPKNHHAGHGLTAVRPTAHEAREAGHTLSLWNQFGHHIREHNGPASKKPMSSMGGAMRFVGGVAILASGLGVAEMLRRAYVTRAVDSSGKAFVGQDAMVRIMAPPDGMQYAAEGVAAVAFLGGAAALAKHSPTGAAVLGLLGSSVAIVGAGQVVLFEIIPRVLKVAKPDEDSYANRLYPDVQLDVQENYIKQIKAADDALKGAAPAGPGTGPGAASVDTTPNAAKGVSDEGFSIFSRPNSAAGATGHCGPGGCSGEHECDDCKAKKAATVTTNAVEGLRAVVADFERLGEREAATHARAQLAALESGMRNATAGVLEEAPERTTATLPDGRVVDYVRRDVAEARSSAPVRALPPASRTPDLSSLFDEEKTNNVFSLVG